MTIASSEGSFQVEKKTSKFPETMMGDKINKEIATINDTVFEFPAPSQNCCQIELPVQFLKSKGSHSREKRSYRLKRPFLALLTSDSLSV